MGDLARTRRCGAFANQEASIRETLQELPCALAATRRGAGVSGEELANVARPGVRGADPGGAGVRPGPASRRRTSSPRRSRRSATRSGRSRARSRRPVKHLKQASEPLAQDDQRASASSFSELNRLFNALAYNPPGADEGYLFWLAWLNHNTNNMFLTQDADGPLRRGASCSPARRRTSPRASPRARPFLRTLQQITNVTAARRRSARSTARPCPRSPASCRRSPSAVS